MFGLRLATVLLLSALAGLPAGSVLVIGDQSELHRAVGGFRGYAFEHATAWTWANRAVLVVQFPLSDEYHRRAVPLSGLPWRALACLQPENLPQDSQLNLAARQGEYLIVTEAPNGLECVVNRIKGSEIVGGPLLREQLAHARVMECGAVGPTLAEFEVPEPYYAQVLGRLRRPLPWDSRFGSPPEEVTTNKGRIENGSR